jgi:hypothetical protein
MILEKYRSGRGWFSVRLAEFNDTTEAQRHARELVLRGQAPAGTFRLVDVDGDKRTVLEAFDVDAEGRVFT